MRKIRVLLADDHAVLRSGLRLLINAESDMEVVSEVGDGLEAIDQSRRLNPDVVLMDITMPRLGGIEATVQIKKEMPEVKILALTVHEDEAHLRRFLEAGASGYVPKKAADVQLLEAIRVVYRGEAYLHPSQASILVQSLKKGESLDNEQKDDLGILSPREKKVLELIAQGYTNQEAAEKLFLSVKTVETYKSRLMEKLNLKNRADLVKYALQKGILTSSEPS